MKTRLLIFLVLVSGGYHLGDVSFSAAQKDNPSISQNNEIKPQQTEQEASSAQNQLPRRLAQTEQPRPERPIKQLMPGAGTIIKQQVAPKPPPEPWYKNSTVLVAIISAISAIAVALIGLLKRGG